MTIRSVPSMTDRALLKEALLCSARRSQTSNQVMCSSP